jgi:hypothetical protein
MGVLGFVDSDSVKKLGFSHVDISHSLANLHYKFKASTVSNLSKGKEQDVLYPVAVRFDDLPWSGCSFVRFLLLRRPEAPDSVTSGLGKGIRRFSVSSGMGSSCIAKI